MRFALNKRGVVIPAKAATYDQTCAADKVGPCFRRDDTSVGGPTQGTKPTTITEETTNA